VPRIDGGDSAPQTQLGLFDPDDPLDPDEPERHPLIRDLDTLLDLV